MLGPWLLAIKFLSGQYHGLWQQRSWAQWTNLKRSPSFMGQKSIMVGWTLRINWPKKDFELPFYDGPDSWMPKAIGKGIFLFASSPRNKTNLLAEGGWGGANCEDLLHLPRVCMLAFLYPLSPGNAKPLNLRPMKTSCHLPFWLSILHQPPF